MNKPLTHPALHGSTVHGSTVHGSTVHDSPRAGSAGARLRLTLAASALLLLMACSGEPTEPAAPASDVASVDTVASAEITSPAITPVNAARIAAASNSEWLTHGRTYSEQRNSPLDIINRNNVADLGLAWDFELDTDRGQQATPLVIDGVVYLTTAWSKAFALDARTGQEIWRYDPQVPGAKAVDACCDVVNRGMAAWGDKVYFGALDGRLIALDRATGEEAWSTMTVDPAMRYTITGAPRIIDGKVIIGNGGGELGVRGYVSAYDSETGELVWRFYTVPGNPANGFENAAMEMAAETWAGEWWAIGGGGTVWDAMAYDPALNLLYIGVGNGSPWNHEIRSNGQGDNLFLSSIVALRPDTGEYVWHFQTTPADSWDYTATQHMILADMQIDGRQRQVIMQAPKNGFFYVLDRATGEFISGNNYVPMNWASGLDAQTGRPIESEIVRYRDQPAIVIPGPLGGHNWYPMSYDPQTGYVFVPTQNTSYQFSNPAEFAPLNTGWNIGQDAMPGEPANPQAAQILENEPLSALIAWNPLTQTEAWRVNYSVYGNSGLLSTGGGLVFQGSADGQFHAYRTDTGEQLWNFEVGDAILGGAVTYELDGEQYVLALAGQGGAIPMTMGMLSGNYPRQRNGRLMAFKLGAEGQLPQFEITPPQPLNLAGVTSAGDANVGGVLYGAFCVVCHAPMAMSAGPIPDLRYSPMLLTEAAFHSIVLDGSLLSRGMPGFSADIGAAEVENIRAYLLTLAGQVQ